jgi:hypothetical protein
MHITITSSLIIIVTSLEVSWWSSTTTTGQGQTGSRGDDKRFGKRD